MPGRTSAVAACFGAMSRVIPQHRSMARIQAADWSWNARWFSAITNQVVASVQPATASATIWPGDGWSIEASTAKLPSDNGIMLAAVVQICRFKEMNRAE